MGFMRGRHGVAVSVVAAAWLAACGGGGDSPTDAASAQSAATGPVTVQSTLGGGAEGAAAKATRGPSNKLYIVQMADEPVIAYEGGISGYAATKPAAGQKLDPDAGDVARYKGLLESKHDAALAAVGAAGRKTYSYAYSFNGFAAELSEMQAARMAMQPGVRAVTKDVAQRRETATTPAFLGLTGDSGFWKRTGATGENIIVGIIDSGFWPEHPSFSDRDAEGKLVYQPIPGWKGKCQVGEAFNASMCNQKVIGARYFNGGWGGNAGVDAALPWEFVSPRDFSGHGSHTASTAAGNADVPIQGAGAGIGKISGMAPRARISVYKVCWETQDPDAGGCFNSDSVMAIENAVADGVDVINFSISGTRTNFLDPVETAFRYAAQKGIFVATSAGNSGPTTSTVAHPSPWVTTVAAGTHDRDGRATLTLGNGATYLGGSYAVALPASPFIDAAAAGLPGADPAMVALCYSAADNAGTPVLDPAKVAGKVVLCDRGVTARVNKSQAVKDAGGVGMVLVNVTPGSVNADLHAVPSIHLPDTARAALKAYAATAGATAAISQAEIFANGNAPLTASFSSRGPLLAAGGDLLKPDIMAPGQDVIAAVAPPYNAGKLFDAYQGTSMASPHIAGLAALMKQLKPTWSPMMIKSALMTTARDVLDGPNTHPLVIFRQGAGFVQPPRMDDPGLVFDSNIVEWKAFECGTGQLVADYCSFLAIDPSNLNTPSIAIGDLGGVQTVTRRVTNVTKQAATYTASVAGMAGIETVVSPSTLVVGPGETKSFTVRFTRTTAAPNAYVGGQLTLSDGAHNVRVPMVVRPVALAAPAQVTATPAGGSYTVRFGFSGPFTATPRGLVPASVTAGSVVDDPTDSSCSIDLATATKIDVAIPADTTHARFSLFDADVTPGSDIDLCVYSGGALVGSSGSGTSAEEVNLVNPAAGTYTVVITGFAVPGSSPFRLHTWLLGSTAAGNMAVSAPANASVGATGTIGLTFSGLAPATKYLGSVAYGGTTGLPAPTLVRVDTP